MSEQEIEEKVRRLLTNNVDSRYSFLLSKKYFYIQPSPHKYPYQWFWDTCFHSFMLCRLKEYSLAKRSIFSLFTLQKNDGFVGHVIFWRGILPRYFLEVLQSRPKWHRPRPTMSSLIQPTFIAQAILEIYEGDKDIDFVKEILPRVKKYFYWLSQHRDFQGDGLLSIISPYESGIDWKPSFDLVLGYPEKKATEKLFFQGLLVNFKNFFNWYNLDRISKKHYFLVKEVGLNTIYVKDLQALAKLCEIVGDIDAGIYEARAKKVTESILEKMYDSETHAFYDVESHTGRQLKVLTPTIFFPLCLDGVSETIIEKVLKTHFYNTKEFVCPYPLPSVALSDPAFDPGESTFLWRGPTWIMYNWFLYKFFKSKKYLDEAHMLRDSVKRLIEKSGFREYYNPITGEGYGAKNFTWSGLILDMK